MPLAERGEPLKALFELIKKDYRTTDGKRLLPAVAGAAGIGKTRFGEEAFEYLKQHSPFPDVKKWHYVPLDFTGNGHKLQPEDLALPVATNVALWVLHGCMFPYLSYRRFVYVRVSR